MKKSICRRKLTIMPTLILVYHLSQPSQFFTNSAGILKPNCSWLIRHHYQTYQSCFIRASFCFSDNVQVCIICVQNFQQQIFNIHTPTKTGWQKSAHLRKWSLKNNISTESQAYRNTSHQILKFPLSAFMHACKSSGQLITSCRKSSYDICNVDFSSSVIDQFCCSIWYASSMALQM